MKSINIKFAAMPMLMLGMVMTAGCGKDSNSNDDGGVIITNDASDLVNGPKLKAIYYITLREHVVDNNVVERDTVVNDSLLFVWNDNRMVNVITPDDYYGNVWNINYEGNLISSISVPQGTFAKFSFDNKNRLTSIKWAHDVDWHEITCTYNANNEITEVFRDWSGEPMKEYEFEWCDGNIIHYKKLRDDWEEPYVDNPYKEYDVNYDSKNNGYLLPPSLINYLCFGGRGTYLGISPTFLSKNNPTDRLEYNYSGNYPLIAAEKEWKSNEQYNPSDYDPNNYWRWKGGEKFVYEGL